MLHACEILFSECVRAKILALPKRPCRNSFCVHLTEYSLSSLDSFSWNEVADRPNQVRVFFAAMFMKLWGYRKPDTRRPSLQVHVQIWSFRLCSLGDNGNSSPCPHSPLQGEQSSLVGMPPERWALNCYMHFKRTAIASIQQSWDCFHSTVVGLVKARGEGIMSIMHFISKENSNHTFRKCAE